MRLIDRVSLHWKKAVAAAAALALPGCATVDARHAAADHPRPAMWKLADEDTTIYLLGTIHLLPPGYQWRTAAIDAAVKQSDELVVEVVPDKDATRMARQIMSVGIDGSLPPLLERVPADKRETLRTHMAEAKMPEGSLDRLKTWAAALALVSRSFKDMGFEADAGVERGLTADYGGKKVSGLETAEQQFGFFDKLSEEAQRAFLTATLDDPAAAKDQFHEMLAAWTRGDVAGIAKSFNSDTSLSPELREVLLTERNANWAGWLQKRLDEPGTVLVAVGAGHLAGPESVQKMLKERGLTVERVQ